MESGTLWLKKAFTACDWDTMLPREKLFLIDSQTAIFT